MTATSDRADVSGLRPHSRTRSADFQRPVHCLLGLPIDALWKREALDRIRAAVESRSKCWFATPNVQYVIATQADTSFRNSMMGSDLLVADGMPLIWIARLLGVPLKERVAGSDLFEALLRGEGGPLKVYFFGGPDGVAEMASRRLNSMAGPVTCVGCESPGYGSVEELSRPELIDGINRSGADFVVVSLGAKKGQMWIDRNRNALAAPVVAHLGAVVNFTAGTLARAPVYLQNLGLEWLWRIKEEPVLWWRYTRDAAFLVPLLLTRVLPGMVRRSLGALAKTRTPAELIIEAAPRDGGGTGEFPRIRVTLCGSWVEADMPLLRRAFESVSVEPAHIELDVSELKDVRGDFIALLMLLRAHQETIGRSFQILAPPPALRRLFRVYCAEFIFNTQHGRLQ